MNDKEGPQQPTEEDLVEEHAQRQFAMIKSQYDANKRQPLVVARIKQLCEAAGMTAITDADVKSHMVGQILDGKKKAYLEAAAAQEAAALFDAWVTEQTSPNSTVSPATTPVKH